MESAKLEAILGRPEHTWKADTSHLVGKTVLITGGEGSVGQGLKDALSSVDCDVRLTDIDTLDVTNARQVFDYLTGLRPNYVIHLAGYKHAPAGEFEPDKVVDININGTKNILHAANQFLPRVVLASTCKAIEPETVYGASKLIAERMTLHAGQSVARFFNVVETSGNVFEIWDNLNSNPLQAYRMPEVMECYRYFVSLNEACQLLIHTSAHQGRFGLRAEQRYMPDVADKYLDHVKATVVNRRHGDRAVEPFIGKSEFALPISNTPIMSIINYHD